MHVCSVSARGSGLDVQPVQKAVTGQAGPQLAERHQASDEASTEDTNSKMMTMTMT